MRQTFTIILSLIVTHCYANMASPIRPGTFSSSALSSCDIEVLQEKIFLKIDKGFKMANYRIEYLIKTETEGKQIPLLFHANGYKGGFNVWVDNHEIKLFNIPNEYKTITHSPFVKFSNYFKQPPGKGDPETIVVYWEKYLGNIYTLSDLKYFEVDLAKGEHKIRLEYLANVWADISGWVKEYSFRYSLSPARNWKSFGTLEITLDASESKTKLTTNLGQPNKGNTNSTAVWYFSGLPSDFIEIIYIPEISAFAKTMISIRPWGLTLLFTLIIVLHHFINIKKYRKNNPEKKYSWIVIAGSLSIPLIVLLCYIFSYSLIDSAIGNEAGSYNSCTFLVLFLYPLLFPLYWILMWLADKRIKKRITNGL